LSCSFGLSEEPKAHGPAPGHYSIRCSNSQPLCAMLAAEVGCPPEQHDGRPSTGDCRFRRITRLRWPRACRRRSGIQPSSVGINFLLSNRAARRACNEDTHRAGRTRGHGLRQRPRPSAIKCPVVTSNPCHDRRQCGPTPLQTGRRKRPDRSAEHGGNDDP
jgi:hypothetical protein